MDWLYKNKQGGSKMIGIITGVASLMLANILMGMTRGYLKDNFNKEKLVGGIIKSLVLLAAVMLMCLAAYINPDVLVASVGGIDLNLWGAMKSVGIAGIIRYGVDCLKKLVSILQLKVEVLNIDPEASKDEPTRIER